MNKLTIEKMQEVAISRDGKCLSTEYVNGKTKLKWKCNKDNYIWFARPHQILSCNCWCPKCSRQRSSKIRMNHNLRLLNDIIIRNKGKYEHEQYRGIGKKIKFTCENGHEWKTNPQSILRGCWCPSCYGNKKLTIEKVKEIALLMGGKCLSKVYINCREKLKFECNKCKNIWLSNAGQLNKGRWCPECFSGRSEKLCREYLEKKTGLKFKKCKPAWLNGLELDGYCKEINLAFEYNGKQHYKYVPHFHKNQINFLNQQKRDIVKRKLCKENNIKLLNIPYTLDCYKPNEMYKFIDSKLK